MITVTIFVLERSLVPRPSPFFIAFPLPYIILNANRSKNKTGKGGPGMGLLERKFPDRLSAVSVTSKRCAVVWSLCVPVGHRAIFTLDAELNTVR